MGKVLLIIDIQGSYKSNYSREYISKIEKYINLNKDSYSEVCMLIDTLTHNKYGDTVPDKILKHIDKGNIIFKCYNTDYTLDMLKQD